MSIRCTIFKATLVQDSALSVSGLDRDLHTDQPFSVVDGVPVLVGRGLKGAAVAMARRFFDPLPRAVSDASTRRLRRSAWEFADATSSATTRIRSGVGIRHRTGARAGQVLYDREVVPAGTKWNLEFRVDWSWAANEDEGREAEGILGYVLSRHWAEGRCWLGGGVARGLGWCHLEALHAHRLDEAAWDRWTQSGRVDLPAPLDTIPTAEPTRDWFFRTRDVTLSFGEYSPREDEPAWGIDMLAVGAHESEAEWQPAGLGKWAKPAWAPAASMMEGVTTDRAILMDGTVPLVPGSSVRGPMRHAFSRVERMAGRNIVDPNTVQGDVGDDDEAGKVFGTVARSSRLLIRDGRADGEWFAAKFHMHAEDEFSAGSYGKAKRDGVRVLRGRFPVRFVVEGATSGEVDRLAEVVDRQVALGAIGHLPIGGHKTVGAGWGQWKAAPWQVDDVRKARDWVPPRETAPEPSNATSGYPELKERADARADSKAWVRTSCKDLGRERLTLGKAVDLARAALGDRALTAWWCEPAIDLSRKEPPATFGRDWPQDVALVVDEVAFYSKTACWRAVSTAGGARSVVIEEIESGQAGGREARVVHTPARLHAFRRFSSHDTGRGGVLLREWHEGDSILGFTIQECA